jgi:hypothetical protein
MKIVRVGFYRLSPTNILEYLIRYIVLVINPMPTEGASTDQ